jgi:hypothetical protein
VPPAKKPLLSDKIYNNLKRTATIVLPAAAALYISLAQIWHFPKVEEVAGTITALNTFLGVLIQISKRSYYASGAQYVGEIRVRDDGEKKTASLVLDGDPEEMLSMKEATFKISDTGENPIVK